jgi:glutamyl/glutaminyl-tRNA synthetase
VALTGGTVSPSLFVTVALMGRETALERMREALAIIVSRD